MEAIDLAAWITGVAGIVTAAGGVLLAVRAVRAKERKAAKQEIDELGTMLAEERAAHLECERHAHELRLRMAQHGWNGDA